jgi:hypothetical protein
LAHVHTKAKQLETGHDFLYKKSREVTTITCIFLVPAAHFVAELNIKKLLTQIDSCTFVQYMIQALGWYHVTNKVVIFKLSH